MYNGDMILFLISFIAGVLTAIAPCVLPLLPVIVGGSLAQGNKWRTYTICVSLGISVIVVDQYVERIREMADHVIVLSRGHVAFDGASRAADASTIWRYYLA